MEHQQQGVGPFHWHSPHPLDSQCLGIGVYSRQRIFPFRNAGAEESWAPGGTLRQGSMGRASRASGSRAAAPAPRGCDAPGIPPVAWTDRNELQGQD